jgi:AraC family transcriptional activator FtrA
VTAPPSARPVRIVLLAYQDVDELDLFGAYAVLAKAASLDSPVPRLDVRIAARLSQITSSGGVSFRVEDGLEVAALADALVVPGGRGAQRAAGDPALVAVLQSAASRGAALYGVCSGTLIIAAAGLARERQLAFHHAKRHLLRGYQVGAVTGGLVRDGQITSVGGNLRSSVKSADLAFRLLADFAPGTVSAVCARMELSPGRSLAEPAGQLP